MSKPKLTLPCLRARMGDWIYYVTIMHFEDIDLRLSMVDEIHKSKGLKTLIQREVKDRTKGIVEYLITQKQRFFNSIIVGIYGGSPTYQEIEVTKSSKISEEEKLYLEKTFGILTLDGSEHLFAIDGQHRTKAIKDSLKVRSKLMKEEIAVIFVAHKTTEEGLIRTRRLFSTLNRYAKPVSKSEIVAIDEEDNCAIITRNLVEDFELFDSIIIFNKNRSINNKNTKAFTNIIVLYDFVVTILTNQKVFGINVSGENYKNFTHRRVGEDEINIKQKIVENLFEELFTKIPSLSKFLETKQINRVSHKTSLLFKPIGQNILYSTIKVAIDKNKKDELIAFFSKDNFNLSNIIWRKIFLDEETNRIKTDRGLQKYAFQLILKHIGINVTLSKKDKEIFEKFKIKSVDL